jgi:hypothetical protein
MTELDVKLPKSGRCGRASQDQLRGLSPVFSALFPSLIWLVQRKYISSQTDKIYVRMEASIVKQAAAPKPTATQAITDHKSRKVHKNRRSNGEVSSIFDVHNSMIPWTHVYVHPDARIKTGVLDDVRVSSTFVNEGGWKRNVWSAAD